MESGSSNKDLECPLCLQLLCEPVSTECGHCFCRNCLTQAFEKNGRNCPLCRARCITCAEAAPLNFIVRALVEKLDPVAYAQRETDAIKTRKQWSRCSSSELLILQQQHGQEKIPLFCLAEPVFPNQPVHLHIFEPRYRLMLERIIVASGLVEGGTSDTTTAAVLRGNNLAGDYEEEEEEDVEQVEVADDDEEEEEEEETLGARRTSTSAHTNGNIPHQGTSSSSSSSSSTPRLQSSSSSSSLSSPPPPTSSSPSSFFGFGFVPHYTPRVGMIGTFVQILDVKQLPTGTYLVKGKGTFIFQITRTWVEEGTSGLHYALTKRRNVLPPPLPSTMTPSRRQRQLQETQYPPPSPSSLPPSSRRVDLVNQERQYDLSQSGGATTTTTTTDEDDEDNDDDDNDESTNYIAAQSDLETYTLISQAVHVLVERAESAHSKMTFIGNTDSSEYSTTSTTTTTASTSTITLPLPPSIHESTTTATSSLSSSNQDSTTKKKKLGISQAILGLVGGFDLSEVIATAADLVLQDTSYTEMARKTTTTTTGDDISISPLSSDQHANTYSHASSSSKNSINNSSSSSAEKEMLLLLQRRHQALCTLRCYAIARVLARHVELTLIARSSSSSSASTAAKSTVNSKRSPSSTTTSTTSTSSISGGSGCAGVGGRGAGVGGGGSSTAVSRFRMQYGEAPVAFNAFEYITKTTPKKNRGGQDPEVVVPTAVGANQKGIKSDSSVLLSVAPDSKSSLYDLAMWLASVSPMSTQERIDLLSCITVSTYIVLWTCIAHLWDIHGFGHFSVKDIYAFVHRGGGGRGDEEGIASSIILQLANAEHIVFASGMDYDTFNTTTNSNMDPLWNINPSSSSSSSSSSSWKTMINTFSQNCILKHSSSSSSAVSISTSKTHDGAGNINSGGGGDGMLRKAWNSIFTSSSSSNNTNNKHDTIGSGSSTSSRRTDEAKNINNSNHNIDTMRFHDLADAIEEVSRYTSQQQQQ